MSTKKNTLKKAAAKKVVAKKVAPKKIIAKKRTVKKAAINKAVAPKKAVAKKAVAKKVEIKKVVVKKVAPKKVVAKKTIAKKVQSKKPLLTTVAADAVSDKVIPSRHIISKTLGSSMVQKFKENRPKDLSISFDDGVEFDRSLFEQILALPGCVKVRCYNAVNASGDHTLVMTGVDSKKNDLYFSYVAPSVGKDDPLNELEDGVGDMGDMCPAYNTNIKTLV